MLHHIQTTWITACWLFVPCFSHSCPENEVPCFLAAVSVTLSPLIIEPMDVWNVFYVSLYNNTHINLFPSISGPFIKHLTNSRSVFAKIF